MTTPLTGFYPTQMAINRLLTASATLVCRAMDSDDIATRHNAFTDYTLALIFSATGHRPVIDPVHSMKLFDLERGWILINDKVVHEDRAWRLCALPPIACRQIQHYLDYLPRLAAWLGRNPQHYDARDQVLGLIDGEEACPFFFYLDMSKKDPIQSIRPGEMKDRWEHYWRLPLNFLRHVAATNLSTYPGQARWAQIQLGHTTGTDHPFGVSASEAADEVLAQIGNHTEVCMNSLGWQDLRSAIRFPKHYDAPVLPTTAQLPNKVFGSDRRKLERKKRHTRNSQIVREAMAEAGIENSNLIQLEQLKKAQDHIVRSKTGSQINVCLRLFRRYINRLPGGKKLLKDLDLQRVITIENSPFHETTLTAYQQAEQLRRLFSQQLDRCYNLQEPFDERAQVARIIISAALFGGLASQAFLQTLPQALTRGTYQYKKLLFLDLPVSDDPQGPVFRWFPDAISQALITGLFDQCITSDKHWTPVNVQTPLKKQLEELQIEIPSVKDSWPYLAQTAQALNVLEFPGHIAAILDGRTNAVSIPLQQWVRFQSGKALKNNETSKPSITLISPPLARPAHHPAKKLQKQNRQFLRVLTELLSQADISQPYGNTKRSNAQKKELTRLLDQQFVQQQRDWSQLTLLLVAWCLHLCQHGTRAKKNIAFNTVKKYVPMVARALLPNEIKADFLSMDADDYESLYLDIIETLPPERKDDVAGRLYEFHHFLIQAYSAEELSWACIFRASSGGKVNYFADANIVSEEEYLAIQDTIAKHPDLNVRTKIQYQVLLLLGYRFGLRFSEAFHLQHRDIQQFDDEILLSVRSNIYGDLKTTAAQRIVPLLEKLSGQERTALEQLIQATGSWADADDQAALMASGRNDRTLIDKNEAAAHLSLFIKEITGDAKLRFHHLRHSWATRFYAYHYQGSNPAVTASKSTDNTQWNRFIGLHHTRYPLASIATALGHIDEATTLTSYVHSVDLGVQRPELFSEHKISFKAIAYALGVSHESVRQKARRSRLLIPSKKIPVPNVSLKARPNTVSLGQLTQQSTSVTPWLIEQVLLRARETGHSHEQLAREFFLTAPQLESIFTAASAVEAASGFEFYQIELQYNTNLLLSPSERAVLLQENLKQKSYSRQNDNMLTALKEKHQFIEQLDETDKTSLSDALAAWCITLKNNVNITNDNSHLQKLNYLYNSFLPEVKIELKEAAPYKSPGKNITRRANSYKIIQKPSGLINTSQMLNRILFVTATYFDIKNKQQDSQKGP